MTVAASIAKGSRLASLAVTLPGKPPPTTRPPVVITLTDSTGAVRAEWTIVPGATVSWSSLTGFPFDDDITVTATGPTANATGHMVVLPPSAGGG